VSMTKVNIAIDDQYRPLFAEVVMAMENVGLHVDRQLRRIGVVSGSIEAQRLPELRRVEGIRNVEASGTYQLPPPWSDVQ
jgi:hypothetical protein